VDRTTERKGKDNTMAKFYELTPAYGRDYKTKAEVIKAWEDGKDFEGGIISLGS
jgi:hypothetical protein